MFRFTRPCVISQIAEGLGNQFFCYASARALALKNGVPLILDTYSQYRINRFKRRFLLDNYNIQGPKLNKYLSLVGNIGHIIWKLKLIKRKKWNIFYIEQSNKLDYELLSLSISSCFYLLGYWQNPEYFMEYSEQIRTDLQRKTSPSVESKKMAERIKLVHSVCIHIRTYVEFGNYDLPKE